MAEDYSKLTDDELIAEHKNATLGEKNAELDGLPGQAKAFKATKNALRSEAKHRMSPGQRKQYKADNGGTVGKLRRFFN